MTIVVGFVGADGVVMASDSEATEADRTRFEASKIWECHGLLFGYSGNTAVEVPLAVALNSDLGILQERNRAAEAKCIQTAALPVLEWAYDNYVPRPPRGIVPSELSGQLLVAGRDADGYWLGHMNESAIFTTASRAFHAVGAGSVAAQVANGLLSRYAAAGRPLHDLKLIAYRTVAACIAVLGRGYGVGGKVKMWESLAGGFRELSTDEVERVKHGVDQWLGIEQDSLKFVTITGEEVKTATGLIVASKLPDDLEANTEPNGSQGQAAKD
jgi:20S proteasome alpha/beta subunit